MSSSLHGFSFPGSKELPLHPPGHKDRNIAFEFTHFWDVSTLFCGTLPFLLFFLDDPIQLGRIWQQSSPIIFNFRRGCWAYPVVFRGHFWLSVLGDHILRWWSNWLWLFTVLTTVLYLWFQQSLALKACKTPQVLACWELPLTIKSSFSASHYFLQQNEQKVYCWFLQILKDILLCTWKFINNNYFND